MPGFYVWHILFYVIPLLIAALIIVGIVRFITSGRRHFRKGLQREVPVWEQRGLIDRRQGDGILGLYNLRRAEGRHGMDMIKVLSVIGALFIGIGVIFFVASNWQRMPAILKTTLLLAITLTTLSAGYVFSFVKKGFANLGKSLFLLACLFWGGTIALIGQIYHIPVSDNWYIMWLWAFPILPVAIFFRNSYVYILASVLFLIWNFLYGANTHAPNYLYPAIVFAVLLPFCGEFTIARRINILGLVVAAIVCCFFQLEWLALFIGAGLLSYAYFRKGEAAYLYAATISFLCWAITFSTIRNYFPNLYFILPLAVLFGLSHRRKAGLNVVLALITGLVWFDLTYHSYSVLYRFSYDYHSFLMLQLLAGMIAYAVGMALKAKKDGFYITYKVFGFLVGLVFTYLLSFGEAYHWQRLISPQFSVSVLMLTGLILVGLAYARSVGYFKDRASFMELAGMGAVLVTVAVFMYQPSNLNLHTILANALLFSFALISIFLGLEVQRPPVFNGGALIFVILIITRFIDIGWKLKEKSLFFIIGGALLLAIGVFFENRRRKIVERMKS